MCSLKEYVLLNFVISNYFLSFSISFFLGVLVNFLITINKFYGKYFIIRTGPENSESNIRIIIGNVKNYNLGSNDNVYWLRTIFELPLTAPEGAFANLRMGGGPTREISYLVFFTDGVWKIINTVN